MKCAIYTRVSTDNQAEKEFSSCEAQEEKIKAFIKSQNNWEVFKVFSDAGYTGANLNRPGLQELLRDIKEGKINIVLVYKIDRLTRSPKDFYQLIEFFEKYKVDFISITERFDTSTPAGRLLRNIMLTFAQFERELASERTKDKMLERAKKGMWNGGIVPYGYKKENKKLVINSKEAEIVKLIYEIYTTTGSLFQVYEKLKQKEIKDRQGKIFSKGAIYYILRNIVYTGRLKYGGSIYQGIHKPIISEDLFNLAQQIHKGKIRKLRVYKDYLFGGLVVCKECGSKMTSCFSNKIKENKLKRYYYYRCTSTFKRDWNACSTRQVNATRLEDYVFDNLNRISLDKNYIENLIFRLNHEVESGNRSGHELTEECSLLSSQTLQNILKIFLKSLARQKGIERNLLIKKFIKNILYSKEQIQINLYYSEDFDTFKNSIFPSGVGSGGDKKEKGISISPSENPQFALSKMAPLSKSLRTIPIILPNTIHQSKQRNLKK
jgi:DNA invertase Pin-like site-specific DNA recombinase